MGDATVNGDMPHSSFIEHLTSYHFISDSITTFKANPYGAKSIDLTNAGYAKLVKPTFPYLQTPVSYAKPYIAKADQIGDSLLTKVDEKFPIVKNETAEIKGTILDYVSFPLVKAGEGKEYVIGTYSSEYKKCGGDGYLAGGKALITSSLVITSDMLSWLSTFVAKKKAEAEAVVKEKTSE